MDSQTLLHRLVWILDKQADIVNQIITVKDKAESGGTIQHIGTLPDDITAQDLINLHKERYSILEVAKNCSEQTMKEWIVAIKKRPIQNYSSQAELALLEDCVK